MPLVSTGRQSLTLLLHSSRLAFSRQSIYSALFVLPLVLLGCHRSISITFSNVPPDDLGGVDSRGILSGHVSSFRSGDQMMLFAYNDHWWVQPDANAQLTPINADGTWSAQIHLGHQYAAALVHGDFHTVESQDALPGLGGPMLALATVHGTSTPIDLTDHSARMLRFGGQEWEDSFHISYFGGKAHYYLPQNAFVDPAGRLHLRISRIADQWTCAEVKVERSLGYGTYRMTFQNPPGLEPAAKLSLFTMDVAASTESYREMDFNLTRWGDPKSKNAEYVVQPYYLAANVHNFELPNGSITTTLRWDSGMADFTTIGTGTKLAEWSFKAGVPSAADGHVYLNLCPFGYAKVPLQNEVELVVTGFEYLP